MYSIKFHLYKAGQGPQSQKQWQGSPGGGGPSQEFGRPLQGLIMEWIWSISPKNTSLSKDGLGILVSISPWSTIRSCKGWHTGWQMTGENI